MSCTRTSKKIVRRVQRTLGDFGVRYFKWSQKPRLVKVTCTRPSTSITRSVFFNGFGSSSSELALILRNENIMYGTLKKIGAAETLRRPGIVEHFDVFFQSCVSFSIRRHTSKSLLARLGPVGAPSSWATLLQTSISLSIVTPARLVF